MKKFQYGHLRTGLQGEKTRGTSVQRQTRSAHLRNKVETSVAGVEVESQGLQSSWEQ